MVSLDEEQEGAGRAVPLTREDEADGREWFRGKVGRTFEI